MEKRAFLANIHFLIEETKDTLKHLRDASYQTISKVTITQPEYTSEEALLRQDATKLNNALEIYKEKVREFYKANGEQLDLIDSEVNSILVPPKQPLSHSDRVRYVSREDIRPITLDAHVKKVNFEVCSKV